MSSHAYAAPLSIRPEPSRYLGAALILMHAGAALTSLLTALPLWLRVVLVIAVAVSLFRAWRTHLGTRRIVAAVWRPEGEWHLTTADGKRITATLAPECYVSPYAVVLRFKDVAGRVRTLVLLPDALDADTLRRLRVRLRITAAEAMPLRSGQ